MRSFILTDDGTSEKFREKVAEVAIELGKMPDEVRFLVSDDGTISSVNQRVIELAKSSGELPRHVAFAISDDGTIDASRLELIKLADQVNATPDKSIDVDVPKSPSVIRDLERLGLKVTNLPDSKQIRIETPNMAAVEANIERLVAPRFLKVNVTYDQSKGPVPIPNANGGMYSYGGGNVQAFANGGFPTGIYAGMGAGIHKFAEKETIWEAYVSGKPGQEKRNQAILSEAARRLGGVAAFANGAIANSRVSAAVPGAVPATPAALAASPAATPVVLSLAGARIVLEIGGKPIEGVIKEQVIAHDQETARIAGLGYRS